MMLIVPVIISWILGVIIFAHRKNMSDLWGSLLTFICGSGLLILYNSTMLKYYQENYSTSLYNNICLIHSIYSGIIQYLAIPVFSFLIIELTGFVWLFRKYRLYIYSGLIFPWLVLFLVFPIHDYSYFYFNSNTFWTFMKVLSSIYFLFCSFVLIFSLLRSYSPADKRKKLVQCIFFIPFSFVAVIVAYWQGNSFQFYHGAAFWFFTAFFFVGMYLFFCFKFGFMGIRIRIENNQSLNDGLRIFIHSLNREIANTNLLACNMKNDLENNFSEEIVEQNLLSKDLENMISSLGHVCKMISIVDKSLEKISPQDLSKKTVSLKKLIHISEMSFKELIKNLNINIDIHTDNDVVISCDEVLITEVIKNIIKNAIESIGKDGSISILLIERDGYATIEIKDTGSGIPKSIRNKIFDFGFTTKKQTGKNNHGIGLYVCRKIMLAHKGDIDLFSTEGKGTTIFLKFKNI